MTHPGNSNGRDYKVLLDQLDKVLRDGPQTTAQLSAMFPDYPRWQLNNCIGYLGAIRQKGDTPYAPSTIWHPKDENAPVPPVDKWLKERLGNGPVPSAALATEATERGVAKSQLEQAYKRLELKSQKADGRWYKCLPGQSVAVDTIVLSTHDLNVGTTAVARQLLGTNKYMTVVERVHEMDVEDNPGRPLTETHKRVRQCVNYGAAHGLFDFDPVDREYTLTPLGQVVAEYAADMTWEPGMTPADIEAEAER